MLVPLVPFVYIGRYSFYRDYNGDKNYRFSCSMRRCAISKYFLSVSKPTKCRCFDNTLVFFPQRLQRYHAVPFVTCGAVGEVADDGIDTIVPYLFHSMQAVGVVNAV